MIKHHLEEFKEGIVINWNEILIGKTPVVRNAMYYLSQKLFFLVVLSRWKRNKFCISMKFDFKKRKIYLESLFFSFIWWAILLTNSSYEPHGTYVSGFTFLLHQEGPKIHNQFFHFRQGGGTHFLVLAQTLMYVILATTMVIM